MYVVRDTAFVTVLRYFCRRDQTHSISILFYSRLVSVITTFIEPGRVAQSVGRLTRKSEVLGSIPGLATYFRFSLR